MSERIERRVGLLFAGFLGLLLIAALQATYLGTIRAPSLRSAAATQQIGFVTVPAPRGTISDRKGTVLAVSEAADDVSATPYLIKEKLRVAQMVAPILGLPMTTVLTKLNKPGGFVYLARRVPASKASQLSKLRIAGIDLTPSTRRTYPQAWLASQLLGTVGLDGTGLSGLEYSQQNVLAGHDGRRRLVKDALGQPISLSDVQPARPGESLQLTLDSGIQEKVEQVLAQLGATYRPKGATAVVMDPRTGGVLALANWPRVDANNLGGAPSYATQDRAVAFSYEPGSTFKSFTVAGALEDGKVTPQTTFDLPVNLQVADRQIHDAEARGPVALTTAQILAQSSNVGAVTIGLREGATRFDHWVRAFGFGTPTGSGLPGEAPGIVPTVAHYSGSSMANMPIGQGLAVTPLQIATAYSAIANGGILRPPRVIQRIGSRTLPTPRGHRVIAAGVSAQLRKMLEGVLAPGGTATEAAIPGYTLAGKTGTANKVDPLTHTYSTSKYVASFVGFAPAAHPRLLVAVMADEPQGAIYGGVVAAPAFQKIMAFALPYFGIAPR